MGVRVFISKAFILICLVNQNIHAGSAQAVNIPFKSVSVSSKTSESAPASSFTFSSTSLPPVQTQGQQYLGQNFQLLGQSLGPGLRSGANYQNIAQSPGSQNIGQSLQQSLSQPSSQSGSQSPQYYQSLGQPSGLGQNVNPFAAGQNLVFTPNQNQNSGLNNLGGTVSSTNGGSLSSNSELNIISSPSPSQGSASLSLISQPGQANVNVVPSSLSVTSPQNPGLNFGSLNLVTLNSNYVPSQSSSSSNNIYSANAATGNPGCSGLQNVESVSLNNGFNNPILPPSVPTSISNSATTSNSGFSPQLSFNILPSSSSQPCSSNQGISSSTSLNISPASQASTKPTFTLTSLRPLNSNSLSNININSLSLQPKLSCNSAPQIPSTLPSANPISSLSQSNQCSLNLGISPSLVQDFQNLPTPTCNVNAPTYAQNTPKVSISPTFNLQPSTTSCSANNQQLNSPSNVFFPVQNVNTGPQQTTNAVTSCNTPTNPTSSVNFGQLTLQSPVNSGVSCSCQNVQNTPSGASFNLALDQQTINQLFSSIVSNTPRVPSSGCNAQLNVPQSNNYVQSPLQNIPTTCNVGSSYISDSQNLANLLQNPLNSQVFNNIYNLFNQQSSNPYSTLGCQVSPPCSTYTNTISSLPNVYTSKSGSSSNSYTPTLTPASILAAYNSKSPSSSINFEPVLEALRSPTITTEEIASLVSSLAYSVLQQCNSLTSSSSAYPQSNINALPISVSTSPVESNYALPTYSTQYVPQQKSISYTNTPSVEIVENSCSNTAPASSGSPTGIPIKVTVSDIPFSSDSNTAAFSSCSSGQSSYSSSLQPYLNVDSSVLPPVYPPALAGGSGGRSSGNVGLKDFIKVLVLSELFDGGFGGGCGGCGGNGLDSGLLALLLATAT